MRTGSWTGPPRGQRSPRVGTSSTVFRVRGLLLYAGEEVEVWVARKISKVRQQLALQDSSYLFETATSSVRQQSALSHIS